MSKEKTEFYIAWNEAKNEGFISSDKSDVLKALGRMSVNGIEATLGEEFRNIYEDQVCHLQTCTLSAASITPTPDTRIIGYRGPDAKPVTLIMSDGSEIEFNPDDFQNGSI